MLKESLFLSSPGAPQINIDRDDFAKSKWEAPWVKHQRKASDRSISTHGESKGKYNSFLTFKKILFVHDQIYNNSSVFNILIQVEKILPLSDQIQLKN